MRSLYFLWCLSSLNNCIIDLLSPFTYPSLWSQTMVFCWQSFMWVTSQLLTIDVNIENIELCYHPPHTHSSYKELQANSHVTWFLWFHCMVLGLGLDFRKKRNIILDTPHPVASLKIWRRMSSRDEIKDVYHLSEASSLDKRVQCQGKQDPHIRG